MGKEKGCHWVLDSISRSISTCEAYEELPNPRYASLVYSVVVMQAMPKNLFVGLLSNLLSGYLCPSNLVAFCKKCPYVEYFLKFYFKHFYAIEMGTLTGLEITTHISGFKLLFSG